MVSSSCYCGIPLKRAAQYIGIADVILGLLNAIVYAIHLKDIIEDVDATGGNRNGHSSNYGSSKQRHSYDADISKVSLKRRTFPGLNFLPTSFVIFLLACHIVQLVMGVVLMFAALNKNRGIVRLWLWTTGFTALFTGLLIRLYEMIIINEFSHELKEEQEVTYFPGHSPQPPTEPAASNFPQPIVQQPYPVNSPMETNVSVLSGPNVQQITPQQPSANPFVYYGHQDSNNFYPPQPIAYQPSPQFQNLQIPAALQPPPRYDAVVGDSRSGNIRFNHPAAGTPNSSTIPTVMFPNRDNEQKSGFETKFSKF